MPSAKIAIPQMIDFVRFMMPLLYHKAEWQNENSVSHLRRKATLIIHIMPNLFTIVQKLV